MPVALGAAFPALNSTLSVGSVWDDSGTDDGQSQPLSPQAPLGPLGGADSQYATVEGSAQADQISAFSQRSDLPNQVFAPGEVIYSTLNGTGDSAHGFMQGTSMAAPMVTGMVALMQQAAMQFGGRYLSPAEIQQVVTSTADPIQDNTVSTSLRAQIERNDTGQFISLGPYQVIQTTGDTYKRVDVLKAIDAVQQMFASGGGGGSSQSGNLNGTISSAVVEPSLNGGEYFSAAGSIGADGTSEVGPNDIDMFTVNTLSPGQIDLEISASGFTPIIRLFNSAGNEITPSSSGVTNGVLVVKSPELADGTYYYGVSSANNNAYSPIDDSGAGGGQSEGTYQLVVALLNPDPNGVIPGALPYAGLPIVAQGIIGSDPPPINSTQRVQVGTGDVDMFQVVAPDTGVLDVSTDGTGSEYGSSSCVSVIRVFDANGNQLAIGGGNTDSTLQVPVTVGETVYVAISDAYNYTYDAFNPYTRSGAGPGGDYQLIVTLDNGDQNGSIFTAVPFSVGSTAQGVIGTDFSGPIIGATGSKDVDFIQLTPSTSGILDLDATGTGGGMTPVLAIWTFDSSTDTATKVTQSQGTDSQLDYQVTAGSTYYVSVTGLGNENFLWYEAGSGSGGTTGSYTLTTQMLSSSKSTILSDNSIQANTPTPISLGAQIVGDIGMDGNYFVGTADVDIYAFVPPSSGAFAITTQTTMEGSADTNLRLFDSQGNRIAVNDDVAPGDTNSEIVASLVAGQTYYIGVNASGSSDNNYNPLTGAGAVAGNSTGPYILSVQPAVHPGSLQLAASAFGAVENGGGVTITVVRVGGSDGTVQVNYTTGDGTARANTNYHPASGTLTFGPGVTSQTIRIGIIDVGLSSGSSSFQVTLSSPAGGASLGNLATATVTIANTDPTNPGGGSGGGDGNSGGSGGNSGGSGGGNTGGSGGGSPVAKLVGAGLATGKKGPARISLDYNGPLAGGTTPALGDFQLSTVGKGKKHGKKIPLAGVSYDPSTHIVTLSTRGKLTLKPPYLLTIAGLPGGTATVAFSKTGSSIHAARASGRGGLVVPMAKADATGADDTPARADRDRSLSVQALDTLLIAPLDDSVTGPWHRRRGSFAADSAVAR